MKDKIKWEWEIRPKSRWLDLNIQELFSYKDLLFRLVRRDFLMLYQQTLLGPAWIILQPLLTVLTYILIFDKVMGVPTNGVPPFLFYLTGITLWNSRSSTKPHRIATEVDSERFFEEYFRIVGG